jgi:hypothetical protein
MSDRDELAGLVEQIDNLVRKSTVTEDRNILRKIVDALQSQAAEIVRLREALDSIDMRLAYNDCDGGDCWRPIRQARAVARAALAQQGGDDD